MNSEIRKDYIQNKYVVIAPKRGSRPHDVNQPAGAAKQCVFCPSQIDQNCLVLKTITKTKAKEEPWAIKVIANKFPSVSIDNPKAYGYQEVVIETPNHLAELEDLSTDRIIEVLNIYSQRTKIISKDKKIDYILIFKNNGGAAGASLQHSHSQIFATKFLPPHLKDKSQRVQAYRLKHGSCVYCDVIKKERRKPRLIAEDKNVIAFCPWAPMHNYEVWVMPKRHIDNITQLTLAEKESFAKFLKKILKKINTMDLSYNYYFHQVVHDKDQHLYLKIIPRGPVWAGVEIGSGLIINSITPEASAKFYRQ